MHIILADAYFNLGERLRRTRDFRAAQEYHIKGLDLRLQFLPDDDPSTGDSYFYLALTQLVLGEYNSGMKRFQHSLAIRKNAFGEKHHRVARGLNNLGFENAVHTSYVLYGLSGNNQHLHDAFSFAEHSRSLLLWKSITETRARLFAGIPEEILNEERELHRQLIQTRMQYHRTRSDSEEFHSLRSDYFDALMNYRRFVAALENVYPRYYTLKHDITSPSIPDVQSMLDEDTALLQYHLGKEKSFLFVITSREFAVLPLETVQTIDELTHRMRRMIRRIDGDGFMTTSNALYSVLIEPALPYIKNKEHLIIIPDGSLNHLPFEALSADAIHDSQGHIVFSSLPYLIRDYTITYQYSMKLAFERIVQNRKKITDTSHPSFIGLAPVFATDENERQPEGMSVTNDAEETRSSLQNFDLARFSVLPDSEREIHSIIGLFGAENHHAEGYFHDDATKENFLNTLEDYSYIHIASHGFFYEEKPMLSGVLFSTGGDADIDENRDILFAGEIYNLNLNSELIVLSSCESGIGTIARGEGILALTRGFIHAGAHNLLVSLWKITDRHTADLMYEFYRHVIAGETYPDALRNAKLYLIGREESSLPMLWSGFIMIGV